MIEVKYIEKTCLEKKPFLKMVKKYIKNIKKKNILIVFDFRVKNYGLYNFNERKGLHVIRISPFKCKFSERGTHIGPVAEKYNIISTVLHEIRHLQQRDELGKLFWSNKHSRIQEITNPDVADWYSEAETDARIYENKHILPAVVFYDKCCK